MPHDGGMLMITALADVSPLNVLKFVLYVWTDHCDLRYDTVRIDGQEKLDRMKFKI